MNTLGWTNVSCENLQNQHGTFGLKTMQQSRECPRNTSNTSGEAIVSCGNLRNFNGTPDLKTKPKNALFSHLILKIGHRGPKLCNSHERARGAPHTSRATNVSCGNLPNQHGTPGLKTMSERLLSTHLSLKIGHREPKSCNSHEKAQETHQARWEGPMYVVKTYRTSTGLPV